MKDKKKILYKNVNGIICELNDDEIQEHDKFIEQCHEIDFEQLKEAELNKLAENTKKIFYEKYPLYRQCNIAIFGTDEERIEFQKFHSMEAKKHDKIFEQINSCSNENELSILREEYKL